MCSSKPPRTLAPAHERRLGQPPPLRLLRRDPLPRAARLKLPRLGVVGKKRLEDRFDFVADMRVLDRDDDLDPVIEVPWHQVGAAEQVTLLVVRLEAVEPAVLEEPAQDRADAD